MDKNTTITNRWIKGIADEKAVADGCWFDEGAGLHVAEFFRKYLRHATGQWAGKPFELLPWQRDDVIIPLFSWMNPNGTRRYRKAFIELPKKNGKSSLAAGVGLFMLVGDGEQRAQLYSAANEAKQAQIVHDSAILHVESSPPLSAVLSVNKTTKNIALPDTNSFYRAISSESNSKEGFDAHCIIYDELHAAGSDRRLFNALKFAGAARRQPLFFIITTAGDDVLSLCYQQYQYAQNVLAGTIDDTRLFAYIREAAPADDWTDPVTWRKANPSLNLTLDEKDFAADCAEAQRVPSETDSFKRYRLNIWSTSTNPWLRRSDWDACREEFTEHDLEGHDCCAGLDLSKTKDTTALVLAFADAEIEAGYRLLPFFWLPEATVTDPDSPEEYRTWAKQGYLRTTPGAVLDYAFIKRDIGEICGRFRIGKLLFDPWGAQLLSHQLRDEFGIEVAEFRQILSNFAEPTEHFERLVLSHKLKHNGHPVLAWQAGNASIYRDVNGSKRPVKPRHGAGRKIDGIVAGVMALAQAMQQPRATTWNVPVFWD